MNNIKKVKLENVCGEDSCHMSRDDKLCETPLAGRQWVSLQEGSRCRVAEYPICHSGTSRLNRLCTKLACY